MALDKDILGMALYNGRNHFNNRTMEDLMNEYGTLENLRIAVAKKDAEVIIDHIKTYAEGKYQTGTLQAGPNAVTPVGTNATVKIS